MYTSPAETAGDQYPQSGSFHNDDRSLYSIFWPPTTPEQIDAFNRYAAWMVGHFHDRIHYWALWNEQDIGYWYPWGNPEQYGRLLGPFAEAVHKADPQAKVIYGGQSDPSSEFTQRALDTCKCSPSIDVYAYHTYPVYGEHMNPESMDYGAYLNESPRQLREFVMHYPGMKTDIPFFDDQETVAILEGWIRNRCERCVIYNPLRASKPSCSRWRLDGGNEHDDFDSAWAHKSRQRLVTAAGFLRTAI
jgi:hypothetical protein